MQQLLVDKEVLLEKFPGKGGWTFARIPEISQDKKKHFGARKVSGFIDSFELKEYNLLPMGKGQLFLPVKAEIRKAIKKQEGDWVRIVLYSDALPEIAASDFYLCLEDDPEARLIFQQFTEEEQKKYIDWIYAAKTDELVVERMAEALSRISKGIRMK
ncbi:YdeI/OmpD-associated family protein [Pedobacter sp. SYSU D00535]|uniref:DUF1905 domain-containing protein n=1 Tax=Pedobacter sp. SYSU D00535 TaxID=2810308 RepID=UPI001A961953|nr:YdeI/OmpD-associated family protein [Pedobacter sp. SYSU D00535]